MDKRVPLADRMRPQTLDEVIGQEKLTGAGGILRQIVDKAEPVSLIFWGPPGTGKTTLARIVASVTKADFIEISAVSAKKDDVNKVIERARQNWNLKIRTILFVDEIHRFNKAQQDAFLPHVESGLITLIGATTENPSFEVISPLISRSRVVVLNQLTPDDIKRIIRRAVKLEKLDKKITPDAIGALAELSHGDARAALGTLEVAAGLIQNRQKITRAVVENAAGRKLPSYDKTGDGHYDTISAFIKSLRAGDETAALYYLARMIQAGEDPKFIARRMVVFASEDIGLAGNFALTLAVSCFEAVERIGLPECGINLSHTVVALCRSKKSRASYNEWTRAQKLAAQFPDAPIPLSIRNAPTRLMKNLGYNKGYKWQAGFKLAENYLPDAVAEFVKKSGDSDSAKK
ncbi:MAG: replication-associated recombination protein A [Candidatus Nomurabacteria bacterium]|jgi:putative ATPase|nr:replication-associated recombination protein A [Candidatus Nomurabacteria bacterium]